jgi:hypothetical protein
MFLVVSPGKLTQLKPKNHRRFTMTTLTKPFSISFLPTSPAACVKCARCNRKLKTSVEIAGLYYGTTCAKKVRLAQALENHQDFLTTETPVVIPAAATAARPVIEVQESEITKLETARLIMEGFEVHVMTGETLLHTLGVSEVELAWYSKEVAILKARKAA